MHHDFETWFEGKDGTLLREMGAKVTYTEDLSTVAGALADVDILYLAANQPVEDADTQDAIIQYAEAGGSLLLVHPALWYNWANWPAYNSVLAGGGSRSHPPYGSFQVDITDAAHPIMEGVPSTFEVTDELYRFERAEDGSSIHVLAEGTEEETGDRFPVIFTVNHPTARIVGITLGHDGATHELPAYEAVLKNSIAWLIQ